MTTARERAMQIADDAAMRIMQIAVKHGNPEKTRGIGAIAFMAGLEALLDDAETVEEMARCIDPDVFGNQRVNNISISGIESARNLAGRIIATLKRMGGV